MTNTIRAWHFTGDTLRAGSPIPPVGVKLTVPGPVRLCKHGLHGSVHPFDALRYAPGPMLHLVEHSGEIVHGDDKLASTERTIITSMDSEPLLRYFTRQQALSVVHLWDAPQVVLDYLMGDESAWAAAWAAARADFAALVNEAFEDWL